MRLWIAALTLSLSITPAFAQEAEYWASTDLDRNFLFKFINDSLCASSARYEESCRAGVREARALVGADLNAPIESFEAELLALEERASENAPVQMIRAYAINGHLTSFDPYARVLPMAREVSTAHRKAEAYTGVGIDLQRQGEGFFVYEVHSGGPAEEAGVRAGDVLVSVAATSGALVPVQGLSFDTVAAMIRGPQGEPVTLKLERDGQVYTVNLKRAPVAIPYTEYKHLDDNTDYLRVRSFESSVVCDEVHAYLEKMVEGGRERLVLDLRGNRGGDKYNVLCVAEALLGERDVFGTRYLVSEIPALPSVLGHASLVDDTEVVEFEGGLMDAVFNGKLVVLVDSLTASGGEMLAGALRDHGRAALVGERTYGKGSEQTFERVPGNDSILLAWTSAHFYQPRGGTNQGVGLVPDFVGGSVDLALDVLNRMP